MGLKFRKSIKIAPGIKLNLNKKSTSITFGGKGIHHTVNSTGRKTTTVGIPGTGLSYSTSTNGKSKATPKHVNSNNVTTSHQPNNKDDKKWYEKNGWIIFFLIFFFPVGLFLMWKSNWKKIPKIIISAFWGIAFIMYMSSPKLETISISADIKQVYDINTEIPITINTEPNNFTIPESSFELTGGTITVNNDSYVFSSDEEGEYKIYVKSGSIKSNELTFTIEDKAAIAKAEEEARKEAEEQVGIEEEAAKEAEEERIAAEQKAAEEAQRQAELQAQEAEQQTSNESQDTTEDPVVYITNTGSKYHRGTCRTLKDSKIETTLSAASGTYEPCGICNPPT